MCVAVPLRNQQNKKAHMHRLYHSSCLLVHRHSDPREWRVDVSQGAAAVHGADPGARPGAAQRRSRQQAARLCRRAARLLHRSVHERHCSVLSF